MGRTESVSRLGVFTSGGDAPGMNACIRAVVRTAIARGLEVVGLRRGFAGILEGDFVEMDLSSVSNVVQHGGTILKTSRCREMYEPVGREAAAKKLRERGIDALVPIGGDGTFHGAHLLWEEHGVLSVGTPGTIDADYRGEVGIIMINHGAEPFRIRRGDRIAQLVVAAVAESVWEETDELRESERSDGGFGHSGV
jgi:deoxyuridine 5'-triphosphate nucleotidohydrolase